MSRLEELPPDQRAALSILLRQRKSYAEVAAMLGIGEQAVHDRAHAALAVLAPGAARGLDPALRAEIGDYMLSQQPGVAERLRTRTLLSSNAQASRWGHALAAELKGEGELPDLPPAPAAATAPDGESAASQRLAEAAASPSLWEPPAARSSRLGGALLLGAIVVAVVVVLILVFAGGGSSHKHTSSTSSTATKTGPKQEARFPLKAPRNSASTGTVEILSEGGKHAFYIQAEHIPATRGRFFYAVWLYNSPTSALALSKSPPVGKSHKLAGAALLPENAGEFREILLTKETSTHPKRPGHIVLQGPFKLPG
jgi:Sigma-70, region 4